MPPPLSTRGRSANRQCFERPALNFVTSLGLTPTWCLLFLELAIHNRTAQQQQQSSSSTAVRWRQRASVIFLFLRLRVAKQRGLVPHNAVWYDRMKKKCVSYDITRAPALCESATVHTQAAARYCSAAACGLPHTKRRPREGLLYYAAYYCAAVGLRRLWSCRCCTR